MRLKKEPCSWRVYGSIEQSRKNEVPGRALQRGGGAKKMSVQEEKRQRAAATSVE